jgi:cell division protease FtsH
MNYFEEIIGYENIKYELNRIIDYLNNKEKYDKIGARKPDNVILYGEPGLGKTKTAKLFINALNRSKYIINKNKTNGEFLEYLKKTINDASKNAPSVILFDDLDKYSNNDDAHTYTDEFILIQSLMDENSDKDIYYIATANDMLKLPKSLLRTKRLGLELEFNSPTLEDSKKIIKHYLENKKICQEIDYDLLSKMLVDKSCADLENIMNEAAINAAYDNREKISMQDIVKAILKELYSAPASFEPKTPKQLQTIAIHEAGHVVVQEYLEPGSTNFVSIEDNIGGITNVCINSDYWSDITYMENRVLSILGGKAATEIVFNKTDVGVNMDMTRARQIVKRFYDDYCMKGFLTDQDEEKEICNKLNEYYIKAKEIIFNNKDKVYNIANELLAKKTLLNNEIKEILNN